MFRSMRSNHLEVIGRIHTIGHKIDTIEGGYLLNDDPFIICLTVRYDMQVIGSGRQ